MEPEVPDEEVQRIPTEPSEVEELEMEEDPIPGMGCQELVDLKYESKDSWLMIGRFAKQEELITHYESEDAWITYQVSSTSERVDTRGERKSSLMMLLTSASAGQEAYMIGSSSRASWVRGLACAERMPGYQGHYSFMAFGSSSFSDKVEYKNEGRSNAMALASSATSGYESRYHQNSMSWMFINNSACHDWIEAYNRSHRWMYVQNSSTRGEAFFTQYRDLSHKDVHASAMSGYEQYQNVIDRRWFGFQPLATAGWENHYTLYQHGPIMVPSKAFSGWEHVYYHMEDNHHGMEGSAMSERIENEQWVRYWSYGKIPKKAMSAKVRGHYYLEG